MSREDDNTAGRLRLASAQLLLSSYSLLREDFLEQAEREGRDEILEPRDLGSWSRS